MTIGGDTECRRSRIFFILLSLDPGGTERLVIQLAKELRRCAEVSVCCLDHLGSWAGELSELGVPVIALHRKPGFQVGLSAMIARQLRSREITVAHSFHYSPFVYTTLAARFRPATKLIYSETGRLSDSGPSFKRRLANMILARLPGSFFAVSEDLRRHMIEEGFSPARVGVIYNGIEPGPVPTAEDRVAARSQLKLAEHETVIGTVARLDPVKDLTSLVDAFGILRDRCANARLVIVGEGGDRSRLEERALEIGVMKEVHFTGRAPDARSLLPAFDIFVNCSVTEGVSLTILEAMAAKQPIVATAVGGTPEVVEDGQTGILVPARDPGALAQALGQLVEDNSRRLELGVAGRTRLEAKFTVDRMVQKYMKAYGLR